MICGTAIRGVSASRWSHVFTAVSDPSLWLTSQRWKFSMKFGTATKMELPLCYSIEKTVGCHNFLSVRYPQVSDEC